MHLKQCVLWLLILLLLSGCSQKTKELETALALRSNILQSQECSFETNITADYGDYISSFVMNCTGDSNGNLIFAVTEPTSISGISGSITGEGGQLLFEDTALHFPLLADEQLSPVSGPWFFLKSLRGGYITSACTEDGSVYLSIDDSYETDSLRLDIKMNELNLPVHADILYNGRRIMTLDVRNFSIL